MEVTIKNSNYSMGMFPEIQVSPEAFSFGRFYNWGLALARSKGCDVRNCYLCNHHHYDYYEEKLTCDLKPNEPCEASHAISCNSYMLDEDFYHKNLDDFIKFSQNNSVDVWPET